MMEPFPEDELKPKGTFSNFSRCTTATGRWITFRICQHLVLTQIFQSSFLRCSIYCLCGQTLAQLGGSVGKLVHHQPSVKIVNTVNSVRGRSTQCNLWGEEKDNLILKLALKMLQPNMLNTDLTLPF